MKKDNNNYNVKDKKQVIRFSLIKLLLQRRTYKQIVAESRLSSNNLIKPNLYDNDIHLWS